MATRGGCLSTSTPGKFGQKIRYDNDFREVVTVYAQAEAMALLQGTTLPIKPSQIPIDLSPSRNVHPSQTAPKPPSMLDLRKAVGSPDGTSRPYHDQA